MRREWFPVFAVRSGSSHRAHTSISLPAIMPITPVAICNNIRVLFPKRIHKPFGQKISLERFPFFFCEAGTSTISLDKR